MSTYVIAPNITQFNYFKELSDQFALTNPQEQLHYVVRSDQLYGFRGEVVIVNRAQFFDDRVDLALDLMRSGDVTVRYITT